MDSHKKDLITAYKQRPLSGGVYVIRNTESGRYLLQAVTNLEGSRNQFQFSQMTGSCVSMKLQKDWSRFGGKAFVFEVIEELTQKEDQTPEEFKADLEALGELWAEKFDPALSY